MSLLLKIVALAWLMLLCTPGAASTNISAAARKAWGFDRSDLAPHPSVRFGVLANGMRYAVMRSEEPAGGLSARLRFDAGAANEGEKEQGYFHLLEHLIFHGSEDIPRGALPLMLAHRGMKRLTDFNAVTSYDETVYWLDLASSDHNARGAALMLMREIAGRLIFTRSVVEAAKKDVLREISARDHVQDRIATAQNAFLVPGTRLARGPVPGSRSSIRRAKANALRRLHELHYVPSRATLVMVGDFDPDRMEAEIAARFSDWAAAAATEAPPPRQFSFPSRAGTSFRWFADRGAPTSVTIASVEPLSGTDRGGARDSQFLERLATEMLNRRLAKAAAAPGAPILSGASAIYNHFSAARLATLELAAKDRDWRGALVLGGMQLERALRQGFLQPELDEQLLLMRSALARDFAPRISSAVADAIVEAVGLGLVFTQPADPAASRAYLAKIRLADVNSAFNRAWSRSGTLVFVTHEKSIRGGEAAIAEAWAEALEAASSAPPAKP